VGRVPVGGRMAGDTAQDAAATSRAGSSSSAAAAAGAAAGTRAAFANEASDTSPACANNTQFRESGEFGPGRKQDGG
jgi:hypothetical protein